jgi:hypothetical protein
VGRRVVVLEGDIFDAVGSEDRQLAEVLVELGNSPSIPTVSPGPIPNLMAADWHIRTCLRGKCGAPRPTFPLPNSRARNK